jgi:hypothetical protein
MKIFHSDESDLFHIHKLYVDAVSMNNHISDIHLKIILILFNFRKSLFDDEVWTLKSDEKNK